MSEGAYRLFTTPGAPPLTFVTPGFPALLQPVVWAFGEAAGAYQAFSALLLAACPWLIRRWLAPSLGGPSATAAACAFAASPLVLAQSGTVMPEAAYLAAFCLLMTQKPKGPLLLLLTQLRPAGLSAVPAVLAADLRVRRWKAAARTAAWPAAGALAWAAWCRARSGAPQEVFEWGATFSGASGPLALAADNARFYAGALGSCFLPAALAGTPAAVLGALLLAAAAWGAALALKRDRTSPEGWALAGAAAMHLFWGFRYERYFLPVLPLLLWAWAVPLGKRAGRVFAGLAVAQLALHGAAALSASSRSKPEAADAYAWLAERTRPEEAVASLLYARDGYYAGRPSLPVPSVESSAAMAERLKARSARWVLWEKGADFGLTGEAGSSLGGTIARAGAQLEDRALFERVFDSPRAAVYRVR